MSARHYNLDPPREFAQITPEFFDDVKATMDDEIFLTTRWQPDLVSDPRSKEQRVLQHQFADLAENLYKYATKKVNRAPEFVQVIVTSSTVEPGQALALSTWHIDDNHPRPNDYIEIIDDSPWPMMLTAANIDPTQYLVKGSRRTTARRRDDYLKKASVTESKLPLRFDDMTVIEDGIDDGTFGLFQTEPGTAVVGQGSVHRSPTNMSQLAIDRTLLVLLAVY